MDNKTLDVVSEGKEGIRHALSILWDSPHMRATHYVKAKFKLVREYYGEPKTTHHFDNLVEDPRGVETLILLGCAEREGIQLPFPLDLEQSVEFIDGWLKSANYGTQPDHDGDNGMGWRLFTESWGHVAGYHGAIVGVQPQWAMYGK